MTDPTSLPPATWHDPARHPDHDPVRAWQAHVDAGRIGQHLPVDPAIAANLLRTEALFRAMRGGRRG